MIRVKGYEFPPFHTKGSSSRRSVQFQNHIISHLRRLGVNEDDIEVPMEKLAIRKAPASASWYYDCQNLFFSYKKGNFIENLYVVSKLIEFEVDAVLNGTKTSDEFVNDFSEDLDIEEQRKEARKLLGVHEESLDLEEISKKYKQLAKDHHPDKGGDINVFKKINKAHKMLRRELE